MYGGDPCFALQLCVDLKAGEEKEINIFLGTAMTEEDIKKSVAHCRGDDFVKKSFAALSEQWEEYLSHFQCEIPDKDAQTMINMWNPYQAERNFQFSRNISYYATGTFRGVGVRDTAQDILAMIPFDTRRAKDKLNLLFTQQYKDGHCNHYCFPTEGWEPVTRIHSDNYLWLVMACYHIIMEEGSLDYLDETVGFYDGDSATVWEHIKKSIDFCMANRGEHEFPLMLSSDWNDMFYRACQKGKGESIWTSMQFGPESDKFVLANVSWLTGTAAWMYVAVTQYMFGIKPKWNGLEIDPCLPEEMLPAKVTRVFRGKKYNITITQKRKCFIDGDDTDILI